MAGFDLNPLNHPLPAEIPILSLFNLQHGSRSREISPGMDTETIADILSDRLIEVVKKDVASSPLKPQKNVRKTPRR